MSRFPLLAKLVGYYLSTILILFLITRYTIFWLDWPTVMESFRIVLGLLETTDSANENIPTGVAWLQLFICLLGFLLATWMCLSRSSQLLASDAVRFSDFSAYIIRAAFWSVLLIGLVDAGISLLRVENAMALFFSESTVQNLSLAEYRGTYVHFPLIGVSLILAALMKSLNFVWLALLVVMAEFLIVVTRFIFSYEQTFMGDLVRFWYAALFLFASAYTLLEDAHVRVDVFFTRFKKITKLRINALGSILLGLPLCFVILWLGMGSKQSSIIAPLISFEVSQSSYGMYVKYLMSIFLAIFAFTMAMQFISYYFASLSGLRGESAEPLFKDTGE